MGLACAGETHNCNTPSGGSIPACAGEPHGESYGDSMARSITACAGEPIPVDGSIPACAGEPLARGRRHQAWTS